MGGAMPRKILIAVLGLVVVGGALGWFNRNSIATALLMRRIESTKQYVAPTQAVVWDKGPDTADTPLARPGDPDAPLGVGLPGHWRMFKNRLFRRD